MFSRAYVAGFSGLATFVRENNTVSVQVNFMGSLLGFVLIFYGLSGKRRTKVRARQPDGPVVPVKNEMLAPCA